MGVTQSIGSMARIIGPLFALSLMDLRLELPYLICAFIAIIAAVLAWLLLVQPDKSVASSQEICNGEESEETKQRINLRDKNEEVSGENNDEENLGPTRINLRTDTQSPSEENPSEKDPRDELKPPIRLKLPDKDEPRETGSTES